MAKSRPQPAFGAGSDRTTVFHDGSGIKPSLTPGKWVGWWADGTPMTDGDDDAISRFGTRDEAVQALVAGGEGPRA